MRVIEVCVFVSITALLCACTLTGCGPKNVSLTSLADCGVDAQGQRAEWILKCAAAANPMSDEEGEDLVRQCEQTSANLFCESKLHYFDGWDWRSCAKAGQKRYIEACAGAATP